MAPGQDWATPSKSAPHLRCFGLPPLLRSLSSFRYSCELLLLRVAADSIALMKGILTLTGESHCTKCGDLERNCSMCDHIRTAYRGNDPPASVSAVQAAKNRLAHTEPAAGAVGLAATAARLGRADTSARFLHLRTLNPYVASIAEGFSRQRGWVARRQPGALLGSPDLRCGLVTSLCLCGMSASPDTHVSATAQQEMLWCLTKHGLVCESLPPPGSQVVRSTDGRIGAFPRLYDLAQTNLANIQ